MNDLQLTEKLQRDRYRAEILTAAGLTSRAFDRFWRGLTEQQRSELVERLEAILFELEAA